MRLDKAVFTRKLAQSRSRAGELIARGDVCVNGTVCTKSACDVGEDDVLTVADSIGYVSRAGLKLQHALRTFSLSCENLNALDIGASTGGFTQCLLKHGARHVWAVDVGRGQMAPELARDAHVTLMEGINARTLTPDRIDGQKDLAVMDVSFISQTVIFPALFACLKDGAPAVTLLKPQFEAGEKALNKHGVVRALAKELPRIMEQTEYAAHACGYGIARACASPIAGSDGNREFLLLLKKNAPPFDFLTFCKENVT